MYRFWIADPTRRKAEGLAVRGDLNYSERNLVEKFSQTVTMRINRFHETWNGSQPSAERWLTADTTYYNDLRSHQALNNQPPVKQLANSI